MSIYRASPSLIPSSGPWRKYRNFFWADKASLWAEGEVSQVAARPRQNLGELGRPGYRADGSPRPEFARSMREQVPVLRQVRQQHLTKAYQHYALRERIFAFREGHTAVRFSQLATLSGDPARIARAQVDEKLFVLRGKVEITPDIAREIRLKQACNTSILTINPRLWLVSGIFGAGPVKPKRLTRAVRAPGRRPAGFFGIHASDCIPVPVSGAAAGTSVTRRSRNGIGQISRLTPNPWS